MQSVFESLFSIRVPLFRTRFLVSSDPVVPDADASSCECSELTVRSPLREVAKLASGRVRLVFFGRFRLTSILSIPTELSPSPSPLVHAVSRSLL